MHNACCNGCVDSLVYNATRLADVMVVIASRKGLKAKPRACMATLHESSIHHEKRKDAILNAWCLSTCVFVCFGGKRGKFSKNYCATRAYLLSKSLDKKRKDYAFRRQFNENLRYKPGCSSSIPGCPQIPYDLDTLSWQVAKHHNKRIARKPHRRCQKALTALAPTR